MSPTPVTYDVWYRALNLQFAFIAAQARLFFTSAYYVGTTVHLTDLDVLVCNAINRNGSGELCRFEKPSDLRGSTATEAGSQAG